MGGAAGGREPGVASLVLVVEDNEQNLKLTCDLLRHAGIETVAARSATEGIELARARRPGLVLMDLRLPDASGFDALRALRDDPSTADLKIVVVTSSAMVGDRERCLAEGFDDYVSKPIDARSFAADVERWLATPRALSQRNLERGG